MGNRDSAFGRARDLILSFDQEHPPEDMELRNPRRSLSLLLSAALRGAMLLNRFTNRLAAKRAVLCSECFQDEGLRLEARRVGIPTATVCPHCAADGGHKLTRPLLELLAHRFFVWGTLNRFEYGAAPSLAFNRRQTTVIRGPAWLERDILLVSETLGVGFFPYGPRLWMLGEVEPLKALQDPGRRPDTIERIVGEYPAKVLPQGGVFYRLRRRPAQADSPSEYDSPPDERLGTGRFDTHRLPVMYASQDMQVCLHECRVSAEDDICIATLAAARDLTLLDLAIVLREEGVTEFESLDMAVHMLFLAGEHAYEITRDIAVAAREAGYDGLIYPSYFSLLRTGTMPFETRYGISVRRFPSQENHEDAKTIRNLAMFGRPISSGDISVRSINKVVLTRVDYHMNFGPVGV